MALLSLCLYEKPVFLYKSLEGLNPVTGGWSLFSNNNSLLPKLTDMINLSPIFIESSIIVVGSLVAVLILWGVFIFCKHCSYQLGNDIEIDKLSLKKDQTDASLVSLKSSKGVTITYNYLLFPLISGFILVLSLSAFLKNSRKDSSG